MSADRPGLAADAVLFGLTVFWAATFVVVKDALVHADAITFLVLRFSIGAAVGSAFCWRQLARRRTWRAGLVLSGLLFVGYLLQTVGLESTTPSRSAFFTGLSVLVVPFVSYALFGRRPGPAAMIGVLLAVGGLYFLSGRLEGGPSLRGDLLTLGCALAYGGHIGLLEKLGGEGPPLALVTVQLWGVAVLAVLCLPLRPLHFEPTWGLWGAVGLSAVFSSVVAISLQTWAQTRTPAVRAALIFSLEPVLAAAFSTALGRERLGPDELIGGALILLGVGVAELGPKKRLRA